MSEGVFNDSDDGFDLGNITPEDLASKGGMVTEECKAHLAVEKAQQFSEPGKMPHWLIVFRVVAADKPTQVNKFVYHRVYTATKDKETKQPGPLSDESKKIVARFARGMELISDSDLGKPGRFMFSSLGTLVGRQCCVQIKKEQRRDQDTNAKIDEYDYRIPFGEVFPVTHEFVADWPKDPEYLAMAMAARPSSGGTTVDVDDV